VESPIHDNWKQAIVDASETDTVLLNRHAAPSLRVLRTDRSNALEFDTSTNAMEHMARHSELYFGGDMDAALALGGAVAGRIESIEPVADVIKNCSNECLAVLRDLASTYVK
jgi:enoyl-[acyl-carrier protein] reductase II